MKKWEYDHYASELTGNKFLTWCNEMGQNGWEMCGMQWGDGSVYTAWKREVEAGNEIDKSDKETK